ncbi:hypothetical protein FKW77_007449 [Venturia effusa]|uniref:Uncharacterized protein n=1 Tax=Venturia effusa TaxID=50376 RepID=A0A517KWS9_9PEZI|nr:hypothetical protein FKW77_007449 [Venturia effusa]
MHYTPKPNPRELLPPLLAFLPLSFVSKRPPPDLLPLLAPLLRQRVSYLSSDSADSPSWLLLLNWNDARAAKLPDVVGRVQIEPHPVSGEVEFDEIQNIKFRRLDSETLETRLEIEEFGLIAIYLFCLGDGQEGGEEAGWRLSELRSLEDLDDGTEWFDSIDEADAAVTTSRAAITQQMRATGHSNGNGTSSQAKKAEDDDDDDYWNKYDATPSGTTPMTKRSPAPQAGSGGVQIGPTSSETEYFARYASEVQPAMDGHDPDEEGQLAPGESTLNGQNLTIAVPRSNDDEEQLVTPTQTRGLDGDHHGVYQPVTDTNGRAIVEEALQSPRPSSRRSTMSIERLENKADEHSQAEIGIKQHISTDIKSLYRLARSVGIDRSEFERIVKTELECLSLMELDE